MSLQNQKLSSIKDPGVQIVGLLRPTPRDRRFGLIATPSMMMWLLSFCASSTRTGAVVRGWPADG